MREQAHRHNPSRVAGRPGCPGSAGAAEIVDGIIAGGLKSFTPNTLTKPERLRRCLANIRLTRVAISRWELKPGMSEVAVPVFGSGGIVVAALELEVPHLRTDMHSAASVLTVAARGLSRELATSSHAGCYLSAAVECDRVTSVE